MTGKYEQGMYAPKVTALGEAVAEGFDTALTQALGMAIGSKAIYNSVRKIIRREGGWGAFAVSTAVTTYVGRALFLELTELGKDMTHVAEAQALIEKELSPSAETH